MHIDSLILTIYGSVSQKGVPPQMYVIIEKNILWYNWIIHIIYEKWVPQNTNYFWRVPWSKKFGNRWSTVFVVNFIF